MASLVADVELGCRHKLSLESKPNDLLTDFLVLAPPRRRLELQDQDVSALSRMREATGRAARLAHCPCPQRRCFAKNVRNVGGAYEWANIRGGCGELRLDDLEV